LLHDLKTRGALLQWYNPDQFKRDDSYWYSQWFPHSFLLDGKVAGSPLLRAIGNRDLHTVKIIFSLCLESQANDVAKLKFLFPQPLILSSTLHFSEILEFLCQQLYTFAREMFRRRGAAKREAATTLDVERYARSFHKAGRFT
jgi:hypothetical protein